MSSIDNIAKDLRDQIVREADEDLAPGWTRATIHVNEEKFKRLKQISDVKGIFIKDIIDGLIDIYNENAITDKDRESIQKEKEVLERKIKELVALTEEQATAEEENPEEGLEGDAGAD